MQKTKVNIGGIEMNIVSQEDSEKCDCVVCLRVSELPDGKPYFTDDVRARCAGCSAPIVHRPHVPQKPPKVCMECALLLFPQDGNDTMH